MFETLIQKLQSNEKYITLETTPSHEPRIDTIISKIKALELDKYIDGFSATDSPLAKMKYSSLFAALKIQQTFGKPCLATMTMRDKNKIALQSDLLGANDFDVRAILALTGDPAKMSDQPHTKGVFEGNSNMLLQIIKSFNHSMDFAGKPFKSEPKTIYPFAVSNSYAKNMQSLQKKLHKKVQDGALGIITQPVFDIENGKKLLELFDEVKGSFDDERAKATLILGVFPVTKFRTAQFLSAHVPGIYVPQDWLDALSVASKISEEEEYKVGLNLSKKLLNDVMAIHPKVHLMTANRFDVAKELLA
jgi:methylenetetrahydrofolate reductase (NADPH)